MKKLIKKAHCFLTILVVEHTSYVLSATTSWEMPAQEVMNWLEGSVG